MPIHWEIPPTSEIQPSAVVLRGGLFRQEMGSSSHFAMQRSAHVRLGEITWMGTQSNKRFSRLQGLRIAKLREKLDQVPSVFEQPKRFGLTLKALDTYEDTERDHTNQPIRR